MNDKKKYKTYRRGQVLFVDLGKGAPGLEGGLRPCVVVSCDKSNHGRSPQITVCPLSSKLKQIPVHVQIRPEDVKGYSLKTVSDLQPEGIQTIPKSAVRGELGYIPDDSSVMQKVDFAISMQLGLLGKGNPESRKENATVVLEDLRCD